MARFVLGIRKDLGDHDIEQIKRIIERDRFQVKNECNQGGHSAFIRQALYSACFGRSCKASQSLNSSWWNGLETDKLIPSSRTSSMRPRARTSSGALLKNGPLRRRSSTET